jgi:hypothetical protein
VYTHSVLVTDSTTHFRLWHNDHGWLDMRLTGYSVRARGNANYGTFAWVADPSVTLTVRLDHVLIPRKA